MYLTPRTGIFSLLFCLFGFLASAQTPSVSKTGIVSGIIVDDKNKPVPDVTVMLLGPDSSVIGGDLTKDDGAYTITPVANGKYALRITAIGFNKLTLGNVAITDAAPENKMGRIKLSADVHVLKTVEVQGEKSIIEMQPDKKVYHVDKDISATGKSALDVLQNMPDVTVDADGNVNLRGKSDVTILIDGKPATILGSDIVSALQSLPASSLEDVDIITNPSSKYDAQGSSGIINITTKKDNKLGFNGNISLGAGTSDKYNGSVGLNVRYKKWNVFVNSNFRLNSNYNNTTIDRQNMDSGSLHSYEHAQRHFNGSFNSIGATYDFNKYNSLTVTENLNFMDFNYTDNSYFKNYINTNETGAASSYFTRNSTGSGGPFSYATAVDYKKKFKKKKGEELNIDATLNLSTTKRSQTYYSQYDVTGTGNNLGPTLIELAPSNGINNSFVGWADYTDPLFTKNGKLGIGVKSQFFNFSSHNYPVTDSSNFPGSHPTQILDTFLLANYNYTLQIHAGYVNWSDNFGKFSYQAGLRIEDAIYDATNNVITQQQQYHTSFLDLFPSVFFSYQLPKQQSVYLNYSRRTNRPNFYQMLPYKDVSNPSAITEGNPGLNPEFIHNVELSYCKQDAKGNNIILSTYYQYDQNIIERIPVLHKDIDPVRKIDTTIIQPENLKAGITYGVDVTAHIQLLPGVWDALISLNGFQANILDNDPTLQNSGFSWVGKITTNIKLPMGFNLQVNGSYESPKVVPEGHLQEVYWIDVAIRKNFLKNKATLVLNYSDILNSRKFTTIYDPSPSLRYYEKFYRDRESSIGNITFSYRFGKTLDDKMSKKGQKDNMAPELIKDAKDREGNLKGEEGSGDQGQPAKPGGGNSN